MKRIYIGFIVVTLVVCASAFWYWRRSSSSVRWIAPHRGQVVESIYGLGTVYSDRIFHVRTGLTLHIRKLFVKEGEPVKAGAALVQLDENIIRAAIDGIVTSVPYKEGELVPPQIPLITVMNLNTLYLEVSLEQQSILRVARNQEVKVSFESLRNERVSGRVVQVYPRENQFIVRIDLKDWPAGVLPGMTADVAIQVGHKDDALLIPLRALVAGQVTRVRDKKKERIPIKLGHVDGEWAEVVSDNLSENDLVVVRGSK